MNKIDIIKMILKEKQSKIPSLTSSKAFSPSNIALCKYWGKRDNELNLPVTSSFSVSLGSKGTTTELRLNETNQDIIYLNNQLIDLESMFGKRTVDFFNLFRTDQLIHFQMTTQTNIPTAAGLASSASGFAALVIALDSLFEWGLTAEELSILARLGSGSACRSIWPGFVEWCKGERSDGMDSYGKVFPEVWPELCLGLLIMNHQEKRISSREAMKRTMLTSPFYSLWPQKVNNDLTLIKNAVYTRDFDLLGQTAESNAMAMHALMLSAWPPVFYTLPDTILAIEKIWKLRDQGLHLYFTQDAGPNLKLLFLKKDGREILREFPQVEVVQPFSNPVNKCHLSKNSF